MVYSKPGARLFRSNDDNRTLNITAHDHLVSASLGAIPAVQRGVSKHGARRIYFITMQAHMWQFTLIPPSVLERVTDVHHERNMYAHPNFLARAIFWQRLVMGYRLLGEHAAAGLKLLDLGGGSGAFLPTLAQRFPDLAVVDLDLQDARRVAAHYELGKVRFFERDIARWDEAETFDVVVAMDVLEHFADMSAPRRFLDAHLKRNGLLLVSLPTENTLYELGRTVLRKKKPADHYHCATELVEYYRDSGYVPLRYTFVPHLGPFALPLFYVGLFRKTT